jgi:hypothetical protein
LDGGATPSSCLVAAVVPVTLAVPHRRAVIGCEPASAASMGTVRRPSGSSSCGVVEDVRVLGTPFVALSGVHVSHVQRSDVHVSGGHVSMSTCPVTGVPVSDLRTSGARVSHVRVRLVGARVGSWSESAAEADRSWGRPGRPAADRRARSGGDHESGWARAGLAQESAVGRLVRAAQSRLEGEGRAVVPAQPDGLGLLVREDCMASHQTLRSGWGGLDAATTLSGHRVSLGPSRPAFRAFPSSIATRACGRSAAATCSERRPLEAYDALTCKFGGGGEGI